MLFVHRVKGSIAHTFLGQLVDDRMLLCAEPKRLRSGQQAVNSHRQTLLIPVTQADHSDLSQGNRLLQSLSSRSFSSKGINRAPTLGTRSRSPRRSTPKSKSAIPYTTAPARTPLREVALMAAR